MIYFEFEYQVSIKLLLEIFISDKFFLFLMLLMICSNESIFGIPVEMNLFLEVVHLESFDLLKLLCTVTVKIFAVS